ncbi:Uncharacterised protein [Bordetella pertussis]|nr:Uncharacterised protein [Bordetella pertussis]
MSMARSTPAQKPRGCASRTSASAPACSASMARVTFWIRSGLRSP